MRLRGLFSFDPLFSDDFFKLPVPPTERPEDIDVQVKFFRYYSQHEFFAPKFAVVKLVRALEALAKNHEILDAKANTSLEIFLDKFNYDKNSLKFNETALPLFTQGLTQLAEIIAIISSEETWSNSRKTLIQHLIHNMNECPPGVLTHIVDTRLALAADLASQLMRHRRRLAEDMATRTLIKHDIRTGLGGDLEVPDDTDVHYINGMVNLNHEDLSVPAVADEFAKYCGPTEAMSKDFTELVSTSLHAEYILQSFLEEEPEILAELAASTPLAMQAIDKFSQWLLKFGTYEAKGKLVGEIATLADDNKYYLNPHANYYVLHALFNRLANSQYFDSSKMQKCVMASLPDAIIFLPPVGNIMLAYIEYNDPAVDNLPLVLYYYQTTLQEALDGKDRTTLLKTFLKPEQLAALQAETILLIHKDWPQFVAHHTAQEIETFLHYVSNKFPLISLLQLIKLYKANDDKVRQELIERLDLKTRVATANDINVLFAYLDLFPRADWHQITTTEFASLPLLQTPFILRVIETFTVSPELSLADYLSNPARLHAFIETADALNENFPSLVLHDDFLKLFIKQKNRQTELLSEYLIKIYSHLENPIFAIFGEQKAFGVLAVLSATNEHAAHLAKGIFTLYDASESDSILLNQTTLAFLQRHPALADSLANLLVIFQTGFSEEINETLLSYIENHLTEIELFFVIAKHDPSLYQWLLYFVNQQMFDVESMKRMLERPELTTATIDTLDALFQLDPEICRANGNFVVSNAREPGFLPSLRSIRERCKSHAVDASQSGAPLMLLAALEGLTDVCKLLACNDVDPAATHEVKISFLKEAGYFDDNEDVLDKFVSTKLDGIAIDEETRITVSAKELAQLLNYPELVAFLTISEKEYAATHLKNFSWFAEGANQGEEALAWTNFLTPGNNQQ